VPDDIIFTNYNPSYKITATSFSSMGQVLCRTGATTATECGEVSDLGADESMAWPDGTTHTYHQMGNINVCGAKGGDSGGPYYKKHRAFGIHSGHNDCYEIYQGVRQAEADWNVKVVLEH
jgi:Trypsin